MTLNDIQKAFGQISADENLKKFTKEYLLNKQSENSKTSGKIYKFFIAAAAAVLIFATGIYELWFVPVTVVSIDVNPSIEMNINRLNRIMSAKALNDDGTEILQSLSINGKKYQDAVNEVLTDDVFSKYAQDAAVTFTVASENQEEIINNINGCIKNTEKHGVCVAVSSDSINEAHNAGLSIGKYRLYLEILKYDPDFTPEQCRNMTMKELNELKTKLIGSSDNSNSSNSIDKPGNGKQNHGMGNGKNSY